MIDAIRLQSDIATGVSVAGVGAILATWGRLFGIGSEKRLTGFSLPSVLVFPLILFSSSFVLNYILYSSITGFYYEISTGINATSGDKITNPGQYFNDEYVDFLGALSLFQMISIVAGLVLLCTWFFINIVRRDYHGESQQNAS